MLPIIRKKEGELKQRENGEHFAGQFFNEIRNRDAPIFFFTCINSPEGQFIKSDIWLIWTKRALQKTADAVNVFFENTALYDVKQLALQLLPVEAEFVIDHGFGERIASILTQGLSSLPPSRTPLDFYCFTFDVLEATEKNWFFAAAGVSVTVCINRFLWE